MKVVVVGGRLQGVEAAYLARMAGITCTVVDRDPDAPAAGLCDEFIHGDAADFHWLADQCRGADMILPACEDRQLLETLVQVSGLSGVPLLYDRDAYAISSSKLVSDRLFADLGVPAPVPWPDCGLPAVAKPSGASGSEGVRLLHTPADVEAVRSLYPRGDVVLQQYVEGPSYSVEVIGDGVGHAVLATTELFMDEAYDCCRVLAPGLLPAPLERELGEIANRLARSLNIRGIFDIEVILHRGQLKVLEIDARLPSQTPTAVYHATGVNMVEELVGMARGNPVERIEYQESRTCLYEHIHVKDGAVRVLGEHCMGQCGRLHLEQVFFGADTAITSYAPGAAEWVATMIFTGASREELLARHEEMLAQVV